MTIFDPRKNVLRIDEKFFPAFALCGSRLSPGTRYLYSWLYWLKSARPHWKIFLSDLALFTGCTARTVQTYLKSLEEQNFIRLHSGQEGIKYDLLIHDAMKRMEMIFERVARRVSSPAHEAKNFQETHEKFSPPLIKDIKELKRVNSPLSPLPRGRASGAVGSSPQRHVGSGGILSDFEKLWEAWPVKKSRAAAQGLFLRLFRKGVLPSLDMMLSKIRELKERDAHWLNGYPPQLHTWLRSGGWLDEPFSRASCQPSSQPSVHPTLSPASVSPLSEAGDSREERPAPMKRETILALAAKPFCRWSRETVKKMLERADEFYQGQAQGDGESRVSGQQTANSGADGERLFFNNDLREFEGKRTVNNQLRTILALSDGVEEKKRSPLFSSGVPFFSPGSARIHGACPA